MVVSACCRAGGFFEAEDDFDGFFVFDDFGVSDEGFVSIGKVHCGEYDLGEGMACCMYLLAKYLAYLYKA